MVSREDPDTSERAKLAHEIQQFFMYTMGNRWVSEKVLKNRSRLHNQVFNELRRRGFIEREKTFHGYRYRWNAKYPELR